MLQQKIALEVFTHNEKCKTKAMKIAAAAEGVMSVALEGPENDRMVVVVLGIDSATLASSLSKRVGLASFVSISEVKPEDAEKNEGNVDNCSYAHTASSTAICEAQIISQRVVLQVHMEGGCCRQKAMQIAAGAEGVISAAVDGADKERLTVVGEGMDIATLVITLRKKAGYTRIISVVEMKS
uniref:Uncharacterized protein n=1 Tax=Kalanchoe fedtschenkoi TaxID=63787 RepID=A0A7N0U4A0_KALFE